MDGFGQERHAAIGSNRLNIGVARTSDDDDPNVALDDEDAKAIAALTVDDVVAIDEAILSKRSRHWQKTAFVIAISMYAYPDKYDDIPDVFYGQRVLVLAQQGLLEASGDLRQWRVSEVRATMNQDSENTDEKRG